MRLDQYMAQYWPEYSRSTWQKYIEMGYVLVNGVVETSVRRLLDEDDEVTHSTLPVVDASDITLPVVYEDDHVVVINKPSGVLTHAKGEVSTEPTVADFVRGRMTEVDDTNRPGIVHRLDRDTSGIMIAAKDATTKHALQKQFQDRKAHKTYIAIVRGVPKHHEANIDLPIARNPKNPSSFRVDPKGKSAQTHYEVICSNENMSVVRLKPVTGRTHQLRVHMAHIGTPIVGDKVYEGGKSPIDRLCLHAEQLEITIPTSQRKTFTADLPDDMQELINDICT
ncbi:MAG: RluA family pseudouridine synthase [Candidatus Saccharimonadales bacterium]